MKRKLKLLFLLAATILFVYACYLIYNMKDEVKPLEKPEEVKINEKVIVKKLNLEDTGNYYYVKFDFSKKEAVMFEVKIEKDEIRDGAAFITVYKKANLYLNETELDNFQNYLNKVYNNPYRYSYLNENAAKDIDKESDDYYEVDFNDSKYFVYDSDTRKIFDSLFE